MPVQKVKLPPNDGWLGLIDAWGKLLEDYGRLVEPEEDVAYWHNEQTITALLATAAWQTGGVGLVEGATQRVRLLPEQSGSGAVDAWLKIGTRWYSLEAKLCWIADETKACLTAARADLEALPPGDRTDGGIAVCYCVPMIKGTMRDGLIDSLARDLAKMLPAAQLVVGYTPDRKNSPEHGGYRYPGVVLVGEIVDWKLIPPRL